MRPFLAKVRGDARAHPFFLIAAPQIDGARARARAASSRAGAWRESYASRYGASEGTKFAETGARGGGRVRFKAQTRKQTREHRALEAWGEIAAAPGSFLIRKT